MENDTKTRDYGDLSSDSMQYTGSGDDLEYETESNSELEPEHDPTTPYDMKTYDIMGLDEKIEKGIEPKSWWANKDDDDQDEGMSLLFLISLVIIYTNNRLTYFMFL